VDNQSFNLTSLDGTPVTFTLTEVNDAMYIFIAQTAGYAFTIGFSGMLLIVLALLTTRDKAKRPIFILNVLSLVIILYRSIVSVIIICANYEHGIGEALIGAIAQYSIGDFAPSIMLGLLNPLLYASMLSSLVLQVRVVFAAEPTTQRILTIVMSVATFVIFAFGVTFNAGFIKLLVDSVPFAESGWTYDVVRIGIIIFVGISCLLFLYKLGVTIRRRQRMGFQKFGPLQILFIMFGQCLIVPCTPPVPRCSQRTLLMVSAFVHFGLHDNKREQSLRSSTDIPRLFSPTKRTLGLARIR
jgi:pheromone alpha factor receptor